MADNILQTIFNQQFKRSCLPDGPKIGTVALSQEETGECQAMRVPKCGCVIWRKFLISIEKRGV